MAIFYPELEILENIEPFTTEGGRYFLKKISESLSDDYEVFCQSHNNGKFPHMVILKKGGTVLAIDIAEPEEFLELKKSSELIPQLKCLLPHDRIKSKKFFLGDLYSSLRELSSLDKKKMSFIKTSVYLHEKDNSEEAFSEIIEKSSQKDYLKKSDIESSDGIKKFLDSNYCGEWGTKFFLEDIYLELREELLPKTHSMEEGEEIIYTENQKKFIISKSGEYKIKGVAGSGKSTVLARRAVNAYKRHGSRVLILYFNITMGNYIKEKIGKIKEEFPWTSFTIVHFHLFVKEEAVNHGIRCGNNIENFFKEISQKKVKKYDTILIDEVQDFEKFWISGIKKNYLAVQGEIVAFGDEKQNIYSHLELEERQLSVPFKGNWGKLNTCFRFPKKMTDIAEGFQKYFFKDKYEADLFESKQLALDFQNFNLSYKFLNRNQKLNPELFHNKIQKYLTDFQISLEDICVIQSKISNQRDQTHFILDIQDFYERNLLPPNSIFEEKKVRDREFDENVRNEIENIRKSKKFKFTSNKPNIKLSTLHSFKGWEVDTLIYFIYENDSNPEEVYAAITRAKKNLIIYNLGNDKFHNFFNSLQIQ